MFNFVILIAMKKSEHIYNNSGSKGKTSEATEIIKEVVTEVGQFGSAITGMIFGTK